MAQLSINTDAVGSAVNRISTLVTDIDTRTKKFVELVNEKNTQTGQKWTLLVKLEDKLATEVQNVQHIEEAMDEIKSSLSKYADMAAEADSADELG